LAEIRIGLALGDACSETASFFVVEKYPFPVSLHSVCVRDEFILGGPVSNSRDLVAFEPLSEDH
jgi:hypothetical protein